MKGEIVIIGGGVVGVATGIVLQLLGQRTRTVCRHWIGEADGAMAPYAGERRFASQFPAASIFPHSVEIADEAWHMRTTLRFFEALHFTGVAGVRKQRHYDVFEAPVRPVSYAEAMPGYRALPAGGDGETGAPRRAEDTPIYGWSFQTHFAEMPSYRAFLARLYRQLGGEVQIGTFLDAEEILKLDPAAIVNCAGAWGQRLFGDPLPSRFLKGILVRARVGRMPWNTASGEVTSYNYYPDPAIYGRPDGTAADVYFYPRTDGWLLGGTRLESIALEAASPVKPETAWLWRGAVWEGATVRLPREGVAGAEIEVPEPIIVVNREIIRGMTGVDVTQFPLSAVEGYRFRRDPVRLEADSFRNLPVIHNYGHGGAGVTLAWSSAMEVAELLRQGGSDDLLEDILGKLLEHGVKA